MSDENVKLPTDPGERAAVVSQWDRMIARWQRQWQNGTNYRRGATWHKGNAK